MTIFIGIDIGTTSTKAVAFDSAGQVIQKSQAGYSTRIPWPGRAEQDPEDIFQAVMSATRELIAKIGTDELQAIGLSSAMHSMVAVDEQGHPLTPLMLWSDNRSSEEAKQLKQRPDAQALYERTGTPMHPMTPLTKLIWMQKHDAACFHHAGKFLAIKDYILFKWFGRYVTDYSMASGTGLFNIHTFSWDQEALQLAGITEGKLPEPVSPLMLLTDMQPSIAEELGLKQPLPVVVGASDGPLANIGSGAVHPRQMAVTIGTSGAVRKITDKPELDEHGRTFCYAITEGMWIVGGPTNNGAVCLQWFKENVQSYKHSFTLEEVEAPSIEREASIIASSQAAKLSPYEEMFKAIASVPAGAEGLLFLPFLSGERAPHWDADAQGVFFGLGLQHHQAHMMRAVAEGMLYAIYSIAKLLGEPPVAYESLIASGGFTQSSVGVAMMSDLFGVPVQLPDSPEASAFGAVILAMTATGKLASIRDGAQLVQFSRMFVPDVRITETYCHMYQLYERVYRHLADAGDFVFASKLKRELAAATWQDETKK